MTRKPIKKTGASSISIAETAIAMRENSLCFKSCNFPNTHGICRTMVQGTIVLLVASCLSSCATGITMRYYGSPAQQLVTQESSSVIDHGTKEDINGLTPEAVMIKTPTQTFCAGYEFCLVDGRIYYKPIKTDSSQWKLLTGSGLPHAYNLSFKKPARIVEISADADTLLAFSDEGRMYQCYFERTTVTRPLTWIDSFGWPDKSSVVQNALVLGNRGWAVGTRRKDVRWYEDIYGNQHNYGALGIETIYFLSKNGQEIRYLDTGLPADFSHGILGPERGSFIARSLSASASTIFLINDSGEMYTRLADFDTLGCDLMLYKYTYEKEHYSYTGSSLRSSFMPWALPSEDWKKQPSILLSGKGRISSCITILQTGEGNFARELRVAGLSPAGESGYYHKNIRDTAWSFTPCTLSIDASLFISRADETSKTGTERGPKQEYAYTGSLWVNGVRDTKLSFSVPDFPLFEGSCHLTIRYQDENCTILLYPVDTWTYLRRYNPGLDGTPKYFFVTISVPDNAFSSISKEFADLVKPLFQERSLVLFSCRAEATSSYFQLYFGTNEPDQRSLFLTHNGDSGIDPRLDRQLGFSEDPIINCYYSAELLLPGTEEFTVKQRPEIQKVIDENKKYRDLLLNEIGRYRAYRNVSDLSMFSYDFFDLVMTVTMLNRFDSSPFKTVTQYSGTIMSANANGYSFMAKSRKWIYSHVVDLLDIRIAEYENIIRRIDANELHVALATSLKNTYPEYFKIVEIPDRIEGIVPPDNNAKASVQILKSSPLFPGLVFVAGETSILIELTDAANLIKERTAKSLAENPLKFKIIFHPVTLSVKVNQSGSLYGNTGEIEWDGTKMKIWRESLLHVKTLIFEGSSIRTPKAQK